MTLRRGLFAAFAAGVATTVPWAFDGSAAAILDLVLAPVAIAVMLRTLRSGARFRLGFVFGVGSFAPITLWLGAFVGRWTGSPVFAGVAWIFVFLGLALPMGVLGSVGGRLLRGRLILLFPLLWMGLEAFRAYAPVIAFPWGLVAHPFGASAETAAMARWFGGEFGAGAMLAALGVSGFCLFFAEDRRAARRIALVGVALWAAVLAGGTALLAPLPRARIAIRIAAFQPGFDLAFGPYAEPGPMREAGVSRAMRDAAAVDADLVALPEGLVAVDDPASLEARLAGTATEGTLLLGGQRRTPYATYQTAFARLPNGAWSPAEKTRLVIFGEFVPGRGIIPYPASFSLPGGDLAAASELKRLPGRTRDGRPFSIGAVLCFEALFPDIAWRQRLGGADVIAIVSLNDWFGGTSAPKWLLWDARWRAGETGLPLVVVGSMGRTEVIVGGSTRASLPWGTRGPTPAVRAE